VGQNIVSWLLERRLPSLIAKQYDDFLFDIVYTYVNGSDEEYTRLKDHWFPIERLRFGTDRLQKHRSSASSLSKDNNELCFSLRSIEKFMPSFRGHIYIVTDQVPHWLNTSKTQLQLHVIPGEKILDKRYLPTFNSHAVEASLHRIPDLKEYYLYFNDDYMLAQPVSTEDFFAHGMCPVIYSDDRLTSNTNLTLNIHKRAMLNTNVLLDKYSLHASVNSSRRRHFLPHAPHPMKKSIAQDVWLKQFPEVHRQQSSHRFRDMYDVHPTYLISRYLIEQSNTCFVQRRMKSSCPPDGEHFCNQVLTNNLTKVRKFFDELRQRSSMPTFLSINDRTSSNYNKQQHIHLEFMRFLREMYPEKSRFETKDCTL
jgi:hypothetical protein